jgi:D-alanine-D-alanine ligase
VRVLVLMGGTSAERGVSLSTGRAVADGLKDAGRTVSTYDLNPDAGRDIVDLVNSQLFQEADVVFIALHGGEGEDGRVQALFDLMGKPYTGSGVRASSLCMDKAVSKMIMERYGIPTPAWELLGGGMDDEEASAAARRLGGLPVVVKPVDQGSTIGITIVERWEDLEREIKPKEGFYDYERKYTKGMTVYDCPADLPEKVCRRIESEALRAYRILGCEGFGRVDVRLGEDGIPYFLEVNTIPGMTETSLVPMGAAAKGLSFAGLVDRITLYALKKADSPSPRAGG